MRTFKRLLPFIVVLIWLGIAAIGGPYFGRLSEVTKQSATSFLPASAESTRVTELQLEFAEDANPPAILVYQNAAGLDDETLTALQALLADMTGLDGVGQSSPLIPSEERTTAGVPLAVQAFLLLEGDPRDAVTAIRAVNERVPAGVSAYVTGPAGQIADLSAAFSGIDGLLLVVAVLAVLVILFLVYRSPILPIIVLISSVGALAGAIVGVFYLAKANVITLDAQAQGILFILVIGAATDYALLLISRYREALLEEPDTVKALLIAWRGTVEPVLASGGTVIAGLLCLLFSDLNSNKAVGPVAASGVFFAMLSTLTFLPAMLALLGRRAFFPNTPRSGQVKSEKMGFWHSLSLLVARRPKTLWLVTLGVLAFFILFVPQFRATGIPQSDFVLGASEARDGDRVRAQYFVAGSGTPTVIMADPAHYQRLMDAVSAVDGVESIVPQAGSSAAPVRVTPEAEPLVRSAQGRDWIELQATLGYSEASNEAIDVVRNLRAAVAGVDSAALVGGGTAADLDTRDTARADIFKIIPIVLVVITLMLMLLLRSVLAPVLLVATTVVSYLATLGISALVFNNLFGFPGADPSVPLFSFVFLVALGIDYNIFLASRIREESIHLGTRPGVLSGLKLTGNVITSAGVVLAATFAALAVIPIMFLAQLAFIVSFGVLLDTFIVRSLLVPGLLYDIGGTVWWPWRLKSDARDQ